MDLIDRIRELASKAAQQKDTLETEEATKTALVMPFIQALGYDVFDPGVVVPEFTADYGAKKGEKVDYAIMSNDEPIMLFECKKVGSSLDVQQEGQLFRYFSVTSARIGVLTDGIRYRFFADIEEENRMDQRPFLELDICAVTEAVVHELKRFTRNVFDVDDIMLRGRDLKFTNGLVRVFTEEWQNPSEDLVKLMAGRVYSGRLSQRLRSQFAEITKKAFHEFVNKKINDRLTSALTEPEVARHEDESEISGGLTSLDDANDTRNVISTTDEEVEAFYIVRFLIMETCPMERVYMRDTRSYCGVLLDDTNRKPICRLHFNRAQKYIGIFDAEKKEKRVAIKSLADIVHYKDRLIETVVRYDESLAVPVSKAS